VGYGVAQAAPPVMPLLDAFAPEKASEMVFCALRKFATAVWSVALPA
jgi:hypothetical protein